MYLFLFLFQTNCIICSSVKKDRRPGSRAHYLKQLFITIKFVFSYVNLIYIHIFLNIVCLCICKYVTCLLSPAGGAARHHIPWCNSCEKVKFDLFMMYTLKIQVFQIAHDVFGTFLQIICNILYSYTLFSSLILLLRTAR